MGALIMTHSDDNGLVLPPNLAPVQVVLIPIYRSDEDFDLVCKYLNPVITELKSKGISVLFDKRDTYKPGYKFNEHEIKGVPIRIVAGPKDIENSTLEIFRRDKMEKEIIDIKNINKEKKVTIFLVEQNAKKALELADRGYVLVNGNVTLEGTGQDLLKNKDIQAAYLEGGGKK